jgi:multidrug efflux system membrane fusion protein
LERFTMSHQYGTATIHRVTDPCAQGWPRQIVAHSLTVVLLGFVLATARGCRRGEASSSTISKGGAPTVPVTVARPVQQQVTDWDVFSGRIAATESVEVRARVSGFIATAPMVEGAIVKQGDLLFTIDERPYQAELDRARAQVASAQAQLNYAEAEFNRLQPLQAQGVVSDVEVLQARQSFESNRASVDAAQAAVKVAQLNLEWCRVTAPIAGRTGRKMVTPGNLITNGPGQTTLLTTITSLDPVFCYFYVDERSVQRYQRMVREGERVSARGGQVQVQLALAGETEFKHQGRIDFVDNQVDPTTGTIAVRAVFANPDLQLLPGFFARVRVPGRGPYDALLVPQEAIQTMLAQDYVLVVGPGNIVEQRTVTAGTAIDHLRVVEGLAPDDRVIVKGLVQARPGIAVAAQEITLAAVKQSGGAELQHAAYTTGPATAPATLPAAGGRGR